MPDPKIFGQL